MKILILDDEPDITFMLRGVFENKGYEVYTAHSIEEAERQLVGIDILLSDYNLGYETSEKLLRNSNVPQKYLMSGDYNADVLIKNLIKEGVIQGFLRKPFMMEELDKVIKSADK